MDTVTSFLDHKFKRNTRLELSKLLARVKYGTAMQPGTLVLMASGDRKLRLKILDKETPHKGFSEPLALNTFAREHRVTSNYLLWYLSHEAISDYLLSHATGSVFLRVPRQVIHSLPVPLPARAPTRTATDEVVLTKKGDPLSELIKEFYREYQVNLKNGCFRTAAILAGAICEAILYQLLLEFGVKQSLLGDSPGLSKMLDYACLLKLDNDPSFPLPHLHELRKNRNLAVHIGSRKRAFSQADLVAFDHVIRHFGL